MNYNTDIEQSSKFVLCVLLTQFGKTFKCIKYIKKAIKDDEEYGQSLHIVFTMNTLLNNCQFSSRLHEIEKDYKLKDEAYKSIVVFSSKYEGPYTHVRNINELYALVANKNRCPKVIVMCSNQQRFNDSYEFLEMIEENDIPVKRIRLYYDELHEYINTTTTNGEPLRTQIERMHNLKKVEGILGLTATPQKIFQPEGFWANLQVVKLINFNYKEYAGCSDMIFNNIEEDIVEEEYKKISPFDYVKLENRVINYIIKVLNDNKDILTNKSRVFIPGHKRRIGHDKIKKIIFEQNKDAVIAIINGEEKSLEFKENNKQKKIILKNKDNKEICDILYTELSNNNLLDRPLVITGYLCIGMGTTLVNESLGNFTSAIISHTDLTNDDIYQLFGRLTGRQKNWTTYKKTQIYCPAISMKRFCAMEECAINIAECHNGQIISENDYVEPLDKHDIKYKEKKIKKIKTNIDDDFESEWSEWFTTQEECNKYWKDKGGHPRKVSSSKDKPDFFICTVSKTPSIIHINEIEKLKNGKKTTNMPGASKMEKGDTQTRRYVAYTDINDPTTVCFCVHYIKKIN